jgi:4-hydroxy-tetrahydrodipicolinate synthase
VTTVRIAPLFTGVGVALVTIFGEDMELDAPATGDLASQLVDLGMKAVVVAGTTGEAVALDLDERAELLVAVRKSVPEGSGVPVIVGTGAPSARQAVRLTRVARDGGADAVLAMSPPGAAEPQRYYDSVAEAAGTVPVLAYHYPAVSAPGIPVNALAGLPVSGLKDSSADPARLAETVSSWDRAVYCGSAAFLPYAGALGCAGAILALANAKPELCSASFAGDTGAQMELLPHHRFVASRFPKGIKELVAARFACSPTTRLG